MNHIHPKRRRRVSARAAVLLLVFALLAAGLAPATVSAQDAPVSPLPTDSAASPTPGAATEADAADAVAPADADSPQATNQTVTLIARQDSYISSSFPNGNFGGTTNLNLGWQQGGQDAMRILIQWDLSSIPRNAVINSARYQIFQQQVIPVNDQAMDFRAQFITQGWSENGVTWNNANFLGGQSLPLGAIPGTIGWQSGDALGIVQAWVSGAEPNFGLLITGDETPSAGRWRAFQSRETSNPPQLIINFTANCDNVPPTAQVSALPQFSPRSFRVSWTGQDFAPSGCTPSGIQNYDIQYRINGGPWTTWQTRTTATSATFSGIGGNGDFLEFRARATDRAGNVGSYTNAQASTTLDTASPQATMLPLAAFQAFTSFTVSWTGTDNLSGIASYDVEFNINDGPWQTLVSNTTATSFQVTGAQPLVTYNFRARATDRVGNVQSWPAAAQADTVVVDFPVVVLDPVIPNVINTTSPVSATVNLSWGGFTAPGTTIVRYNVFYSFNNGPRILVQTVAAPQTTFTAPLAVLGFGDGYYNYTVTAVDNLGRETNLNTELADLAQTGVVLDMADQVRPQLWFGYVANDATP